ncbi:hypothetical protein ACFZC6_34380 [Streptomyces ossamyceticus]|uniref:Uncharacterized protein n=1 Tax=Streptomyces ossamyceticus TaxID=249581 RepID=A0ABV2UWP0_9ACTN
MRLSLSGPIAAANEAASAVTGRKLVLSFCEWGTGLPVFQGAQPIGGGVTSI